MATKLDPEFVQRIKDDGEFKEGFETLVREVQRLEALCEKYEKALGYYARPDIYQERDTGGSGKMHKRAIIADYGSEAKVALGLAERGVNVP